MRGLPFFKPKNKPQFAGLNFSDASSGGGGGSGGGVDFSTLEQNTGKKWIDNKPVYQKTIDAQVLSNYNGTLMSGIDTLVAIGGILESSGGYKRYAPFYSNSSTYIFFDVDPNHDLLYERGTRSDYANSKLTVTILYTKTSD